MIIYYVNTLYKRKYYYITMGKNNLYILFFVLMLTFGHIQAQIDVACIGNSITSGSRLSDPGSQSYPAQLGVRLGSDYTVKNYGEPARTALDVDYESYLLSPYYGWSTNNPQDVVIILFGTNDSQEKYWADYSQFKEDYLYIMNSYKNYEDPVFCLGLPPPVFEEHPDYNVSLGHLNEPIVSEIIPMIKQVAYETGSTIADFYTALDGMPELFIDGVHPNVVGADIMAEVAYHAVQKALSTSDIPYNHPPDTPTGLRTISGYDNIHLEWHPNTEDDLWSYTIYRSDKEGGVQIWLGSVLAPDTTFSDIDVVNDHIYYYSIAAMDNHNNYSDRTGAIVGITIDQIPPSAPVNLQAILEADSVKINWTPNTELDVEKYHIYRNTTLNNVQESSSLVGTVYEPDSNFIDLSFDSAINYFYGVTAIDHSGNQGQISNIVNITTKSRPLSSDTTLTLSEDVSYHFIASDFPFFDADNDFLDKIIFVNSDHNNYFTFDSDTIASPFICDDISKLVFTSNLDEFGENYTEFSFRVVDSFGSTSLDTNIVVINVAPVNDAPHINLISDLYIMEDSHNLLLPITGINAGPANELQNLSVKAFADLVNIDNIQYNSPEETGLVIIDPMDSAFGIIPVTIQIVDDGGTTNGGIDTFSTTFNMHISPINDPPIFNFLEKIQLIEDSETTIELTGIQAGPLETGQQINISVQSNNTDILPHPVLIYNSPDTTATLTFSTIPNIFGLSSITITMSDNGGTDFGGQDLTSHLIPVEITSVNDRPSDFSIVAPPSDSTLVINKLNYLNTFLVSWEASTDIENDPIFYDVIFSGDLSKLSRYGLSSTSTEYVLKEILAVTDTVSITSGTFSIIASDGELQTVAINSDITITVDGRSFAPDKLHLDQNYPNPFNNTTVIGFDLPKSTAVSMIIYDLLGKEVIKLIKNKKYERGYNTITWNGLDKHNNQITAGIYIMQIRMGSNEQHKKLVYIK